MHRPAPPPPLIRVEDTAAAVEDEVVPFSPPAQDAREHGPLPTGPTSPSSPSWADVVKA